MPTLFLKKSADTRSLILLTIGILLYAFDAYLWYIAYKYAKFSTVGIVYSLIIIFASVILGVLYFREKISTSEIIGIIFGGLSIVLLSKFK